MHILPNVPPHTCFVPPITSPRTLLQSILLSKSSSTSPSITTLSPLTTYNPCSACELGSGSSAGRITRSIVELSTRFVFSSNATKSPIRVRPSVVMIQIFSCDLSAPGYEVLVEKHRYVLFTYALSDIARDELWVRCFALVRQSRGQARAMLWTIPYAMMNTVTSKQKNWSLKCIARVLTWFHELDAICWCYVSGQSHAVVQLHINSRLTSSHDRTPSQNTMRLNENATPVHSGHRLRTWTTTWSVWNICRTLLNERQIHTYLLLLATRT